VPKFFKKNSKKGKENCISSPIFPSHPQFFRHYENPKRRDEIRTGDRTGHWTGEEFTRNFSENGTKVDNFKNHGDVNNSLLSGIIYYIGINSSGEYIYKIDTRALSILV
jgi:hypothetical protein